MPKRTQPSSPAPSKNWKPPTETNRPIFIHSAIDEYGLNLYEFRVLAHVARREGKTRGCDAAQARMAQVCGMSQRKVLEVLQVLCDARLICKNKAQNKRTNSYRLNPPSKWRHPKELEDIRRERKSGRKIEIDEETRELLMEYADDKETDSTN